MIKVLITGGNGFIGHHVIEHILRTTDWKIAVMDKLTYASYGYDRLKEIGAFSNTRVQHFVYDFTKPIEACLFRELIDVTHIIHLGAETHVDRSISDPELFVSSNVFGTMNILQYARKLPKLEKMVYFSTDEVFGPADIDRVPNGFKEWNRYNSTNPYSASKAAGEELALAWANTYKVPVFITHTMNVFGERQHPEKFIPKTISAVVKREKVLIHSDPTRTVSGSRFWIHARNVAAALMFLLENARPRDKYNIVGEKEITNLELAQMVANSIGAPLDFEMVDFHSSRPGHDLRYGLDGTKLKSMGFKFPRSFTESLKKTIQWTLDNQKWLNGEGS
jgi:dTDP-glucose 4,6-dehydratase